MLDCGLDVRQLTCNQFKYLERSVLKDFLVSKSFLLVKLIKNRKTVQMKSRFGNIPIGVAGEIMKFLLY